MAKTENLLSLKTLEALNTTHHGQTLKDGGSLYAKIHATKKGTITVRFTYKYRMGSQQKEKYLGVWPTLTLPTIRKQRNELRAIVAKGINPAEQITIQNTKQNKIETAAIISISEHASKDITMNELYALWDATHGATLESHWREVRRSHWRCHLAPIIGLKSTHKATKATVMNMYDQMISQGKEASARKVLALLKQIIAWGVERNWIEENNPLTRIVIPKSSIIIQPDQAPEVFNIETFISKHGEHIIGEDAEDGKTGRALDFHELTELLHKSLAASTQAITGKTIIRFMLATGVRISQALRLRWAWVSIERKLIIFPAGSMKKRKMHHVHLSSFALEQLRQMAEIKANEFVFPAPIKQNTHVLRDNVGKDISYRQFYQKSEENSAIYNDRLNKRMQIHRARENFNLYNLPRGKWTLYDIRRTTATRIMELTGADWDMIMRILAHADPCNSTTARYTRFSRWPDRCAVLDLLGEALAQCEQGHVPSIALS